jgi:type IV pilus assembly protein PilZ
MNDERERRESSRIALELPIEYDRLNAFLSDYTHNLSRGGTFIRTDRPLRLGARLSFRIRVPELGEPLHLRGEVRWVVSASEARDELPAGMGIAFVYDSPEERARIERRVEDLMVRALGPVTYAKLLGKPAPASE